VPVERSRELAVLAGGGLRWVSFQEHDARFLLEGEDGARALEAARRYAAAGAAPAPEARLAALRAATLGALLSGDDRLAGDAVQDLALTSPLELVSAADVPRLRAEVVENPAAARGVRLALLSELGRRGLVDPTPIWLAMLRETPPPELTQVARAAGLQTAPEIEALLLEMLGSNDAGVAEAAALGLGQPHHANAVPGLAAALGNEAPRVRMAAIRSLGRIATPAASKALEAAAQGNGDPATRQRASAEVLRLERAR
jgi:HEAT repeat protein